MPLYLVAPSYVAEFARTKCARRLAFDTLPRDARSDWGVPTKEATPEMRLRWRRGHLWERRALRRLLAELPPEAQRWPEAAKPGRLGKLSSAAVHEVLRRPGAVRWLVQPTLELPDPERWARRFGWAPDRLGLAEAVADALELTPAGGGRWVARVLELKRRYRPSVGHRLQLAFYSLLLEELVEQLGAPVEVDARHAWLWCWGRRWPRRVGIGLARMHVDTLLRTAVPRALAADPSTCDWHVGPACVGCGYLRHCRNQAIEEDDLAQVPGLTASAKRHLHDRGVRTAHQWLAVVRRRRFSKDAIDAGRELYVGNRLLEQRSALLEQRLTALKAVGKPILVPFRSHYFNLPAADGEVVALGVAVEWDPGARQVLAMGLRWRDSRGHEAVWNRAAASPRRRDEAALLRAALEWVRAQLDATGLAALSGAIRVYAWEPGELLSLRLALVRHGLAIDPAVSDAARVFLPARRGAGVPGGALERAVDDLWALPEPFVYSLAATVRHLGCLLPPCPELATQPFATRLGLEVFVDVWEKRREGAEVEAFLAWRTEAVLAVLDRLRRADRPKLYAPKALSPKALPPVLHDEVLAKLATFVEVEQGLAWEEIRDLYARPLIERVQRGECLGEVEWLGCGDGDERAFRLKTPGAHVATRLREGDWLVLTVQPRAHDASSEELIRLAEEPWRMGQRAVELVRFDLADEPLVWLRGDWDAIAASFPPNCPLEYARLALDRGFLDVTATRTLDALAKLDRDRARWDRFRPWFAGEPTTGSRPRLPPFELDALPDGAGESEQAIAGAAEQQSLVLVWGPPGTGKTRVLARLLVALARGAERHGHGLRVLLTAYTHRAVDNLVERLHATAREVGLDVPLYRLHTSEQVLRRRLGHGGASAVEAKRFRPTEPRWIAAGTVWALAKREGLETDLVVVDEASQMTVPQALVALGGLRPDGALWAAGDPCQLGPIIRGHYPDDEPLYGSLFDALERATGPHRLTVTYRCNRVLVTYPRARFYPDYRAAPSAAERRVVVRNCEDPVARAFLDPERPIVLAEYDGPSASVANEFEAALVAHLLRHARAALCDPATGKPYDAHGWREEAVAVLTPHRAQVATILEALRRHGFDPEDLPVVDTVERLQGSERELVLVSTAVADPEFALSEADFLFDERRFNVCVTRARRKVIVLIHRHLLELVPDRDAHLRATLLFRRYRGHLRPAERLGFQGRAVQLHVRTFGRGV